MTHENLKAYVAEHIRELIFSGKLKPHERVQQDAIAKELRLSKLPVREALLSLEAEGLIEYRARFGAFVPALTQEDIRDHFAIYGAVSGLAARRAAERLSEGELRHLEDLLARAKIEQDPERTAEFNFEFHRLINERGGSRRLRSALELLAQTVPSRFAQFTAGWKEEAQAAHERVLDALARRDGAAAADEMSNHIRLGGEYAVASLTDIGFWQEDRPHAHVDQETKAAGGSLEGSSTA